jgi:hypothetical protein
VYRGDFALGTLMRFLPIVTQILMWYAILEAISHDPDAPTTIRGYSYSDMVGYYLLTMVARAFSSMPGLASGIARDIRDGTIKKYLIQDRHAATDGCGCNWLKVTPAAAWRAFRSIWAARMAADGRSARTAPLATWMTSSIRRRRGGYLLTKRFRRGRSGRRCLRHRSGGSHGRCSDRSDACGPGPRGAGSWRAGRGC